MPMARGRKARQAAPTKTATTTAANKATSARGVAMPTNTPLPLSDDETLESVLLAALPEELPNYLAAASPRWGA